MPRLHASLPRLTALLLSAFLFTSVIHARENIVFNGQKFLAEQARRILQRLKPPAHRATTSRVHATDDPFTFPHDHGAHRSVCEWWYWNGHFTTDDGARSYGFELCFFKALEGVKVCHVALTDETNQTFEYERFYCLPIDGRAARGKLDLRFRKRDLVICRRDPVCWASGHDASSANKHAHVIHGEVGNITFEFDLASMGKAPLPINGDGIIDMPEGGNSWYYSLTKLNLKGTLTLADSDGSEVSSAVSGQAWMDHQWGKFYVLRRGWDWFSFQMDDDSEYNLFAMRRGISARVRYGVPSAETYANTIDANECHRHVGGLATPHNVEVRPLVLWQGKTGRFATCWEVIVHPWGESFLVRARVDDQEVGSGPLDPLATYWEGSCDVWRRNANGELVRGLAYIEHMPYPDEFEAVSPLGDWSDAR